MSDVLERGPAEGERDREAAPPEGGEVWPPHDPHPTWRGAAAEHARLERELAAARRELARLKDEARSRALAREELLAVVGHELRTPVTLMTGFHRLLLSDSSGPWTDAQRQLLADARGPRLQLGVSRVVVLR